MFPSFYIYNERNFQTILDITDTNVKTNIEEDDSSIDSDFISQDDSISIDADLETIHSELSHLSTIDSDFDDNETNLTEDETIDSNPMYLSSGINVKLMDEEFYEGNNDEETDESELAAIIEVQRRSRNYTYTFTRKIYKKKNYYEKFINLSIAICTFAVILNWLS